MSLNKHKYKRIVFLVLPIVLGFVYSNDSSAYNATISTSGTVTLDVSAVSNKASVGTDNVTISTTCPDGYTLHIAGGNDNTLYKNGNSSNNSNNTKITPSTGTPLSPASILNNNLGTWGYTTASSPTASSNFIGLTSTPNALISTDSANTSGDTDTIPVYYGASVTDTTESGEYTMSSGNAITYYLTMNGTCFSYSIAYDGNNADAGTMSKQLEDDNSSVLVEDSDVTLFASNFSREGYGFAGWSLDELDPDSATFATSLATAVSNDRVFGPQETITLDTDILAEANSIGVITMHALWIKAETNTTLQDWNGCSSMQIGDVKALSDARDDNTYAIAKLADGKCWMIENLRLDDSATLSSSNTNQPALPLTNDYNSSITSNHLSATSSNDWCGNNTAACHDQSRLNTMNTTQRGSLVTTMDGNIYSYGNYYNWYSATAGNGTHSVSSNNSDVSGSICPIGWRLPRGGDDTNSSSSDYYGLAFNVVGSAPNEVWQTNRSRYNNVNGTQGTTASRALRSYPVNYVLSGYFLTTGAGSTRGQAGLYASSTASDNQEVYRLYLDKNYVGPGTDSNAKHVGRSVRCLASSDYTVSFDANNGTGSMGNQIVTVGAATYLFSNTFTRSGYSFTGWNTAPDGAGISYADEQSVTDIALPGRTITLYAQWEEEPCDGGYICYRGNGATEGTMGRQAASDGNTAKLFASNFSREGYGFAGWSDAADYETNQNAHFYGPNEDITVPTGTNNDGLMLYAVWIESEGDMQTDAASVCSDLTAATYSDEDDADESTWSISAGLSSISALTDTRDGQTYAIAKLSDGNCWMIENLRLADTHKENGIDVPTTLTVANTNNPLHDTSTNTVILKHNYSDATTYTNLSPTSSVAYDATTAPEGWCTSSPASCYDQSRLRADNTINRAEYTTTTDMSNHNVNLYSYGNYYNWYSATAGNGTRSKSSDDTDGDLCPLGWHLPTGVGFGLLSNSLGGYKDASDVAQYMNSSTSPTGTIMSKRLRRFPNNILYTGSVYGASITYRGSSGDYWSSTAAHIYGAYQLRLSGSDVIPATDDSTKFYGRAVRCVVNSQQ